MFHRGQCDVRGQVKGETPSVKKLGEGEESVSHASRARRFSAGFRSWEALQSALLVVPPPPPHPALVSRPLGPPTHPILSSSVQPQVHTRPASSVIL